MPKSTTPVKPERNIRLAEAIARDGRYLYEIAGATGACNPRLLSAIVKGHEHATPTVRQGIATALGVDVSVIFED